MYRNLSYSEYSPNPSGYFCDTHTFLTDLELKWKKEFESKKSCDCIQAFIAKYPELTKDKCTCNSCADPDKGYPNCTCNPWDA